MSSSKPDPYLAPSFSFLNRAARLFWGVVEALLFRTSPRPFHSWRRFILRLFGAKVSSTTNIYPKAKIWAPWNLVCSEAGAIADGAVIYNPELITIGSHAIVSQDAYLCGATHDYEDPSFRLISFPITLGAYSWICARATVQAGVTVGEGAVLALGAIATRDLEPWTVYGGVPARKLKARVWRNQPEFSGAHRQ